MALSCYFGFGRRPGLNGNSVYLATAEDFIDGTEETGRIKSMDKMAAMTDETKDSTSPIFDNTTALSIDYSKMDISNSSNLPTPALGLNCTDKTGNKLAIQSEITGEKVMDVPKQCILSMYEISTLNNSRAIIDSDWQNDNEEMNKIKQQTESAYIDIPNLYNCINIESQKHCQNIRLPIIEKYVIEKVKMEHDENKEHEILEAKKSSEKIENSQQFSTAQVGEHTSANVSDTYTACNWDLTTTESEYAFDVEKYYNINEEFVYSNENTKTESKNETLANEEKFPDSQDTSKIETDVEKYTTTTSEKLYIQSHYNANDLYEWEIY
uniref:Uncharacterized protein n=1 Tax=Elaeophora elaphi TaxID=1147741 RepID=A0A0R3RHA0_9BILA